MSAAIILPLSSAIKYLDNGDPHFRYYRRASLGVYDCFIAMSGGDQFLGAICTKSRLTLSVDPGKWFVLGEDRAFDSMNQAATALLRKAGVR